MSATEKKVPTIKQVEMTASQFIAHVQSEIAKAKDEEDEYAMKRLELLRTNASKASWESTERQTISIYEEPNLTAKTEESDKTLPAKDVVQPGTSPYTSNGLQKALAELDKVIKELVGEAPAAKADEEDKEKADKATDPLNPVGFWPADVNTQKFMKKEEVAKAADQDGWGADPWAPTK